jgi:hypothetical protein
MPTFQSSPMYYPVFPTMVRNPHGVQPLKGNTLLHAELNSSEHPGWKNHADFTVMARVENNKLKDKQMLKGPPSIKGNFPFTTSRGPNGHALSGGTVWTKGAEDKIQSLLRDRKLQLDAINQASFDTATPEQIKTEFPVSDTFPLDQSFSQLLSSLNEGIVSNILLGYVNSIISFFLSKADKIPEHKFNDYAQLLNQCATVINALFYTNRSELYSKSEFKKVDGILRKLEKDVSYLIKFIEEWSSYNGEPTRRKALRLDNIRNKLLLAAQQNSKAGLERASRLQESYEQGDIIPDNVDSVTTQGSRGFNDLSAPGTVGTVGTVETDNTYGTHQYGSYAPSYAEDGTDEGPPEGPPEAAALPRRVGQSRLSQYGFR